MRKKVKKGLKSILSVLLMLALLSSSVSLPVSAEEGTVPPLTLAPLQLIPG